MKLGVFTVVLRDIPLDILAKKLSAMGVQAVELACGGYIEDDHCPLETLLADSVKRRELIDVLTDNGLMISGLSVHGNAVSPNEAIREKSRRDFKNAVELAGELGVDRVLTFSGCPAGAPGDSTPNWVTCAWPDEYPEILRYQWDDVLIPYWQKEAEFVRERGVKVAIEMHPGFLVYNPDTMLRLNKATGDSIGCNFDPSHLFWQGVDPVFAIRALQGIIYHVHVKDTLIDRENTLRTGVVTSKPFRDIAERPWVFRTIGYGHDLQVWKGIVSALKLAGYDYVLSIEHEDDMMGKLEGVEKAVKAMKEVMFD